MFGLVLPLVKRSVSSLVMCAVVLGATGCQLSLGAKADGLLSAVSTDHKKSSKPEGKPEKPAKPSKAKSVPDSKKIVREAGPIWSNDDAQTKCPKTCNELDWEGAWWTTEWNEMSVCECIAK